MAFTRVCSVGDLGPGEMEAYFIDDGEVLLVCDRDGVLHAMDGLCPHEDTPLVHGDFDGTVLTCLNHLWSFDATTGGGINPPGCRLSKYEIRVEGRDVLIDPDQPERKAPGDT